MTALLILLIAVLSLGGLVLLLRFAEAAQWRDSLQVLRLILPPTQTGEDVANWLVTVNTATHADRWGPFPSLLPPQPVAYEIGGDNRVIKHYVLFPQGMRQAILSGLRASLPGIRLEDEPEYLAHRPRFATAAEGALSNHRRPLNAELAATASAARLASLQPLYGSEEVWVQWLFFGAGIPPRVPSVSAQRKMSSAWPTDQTDPPDPEAIQAARLKQQRSLFRATVRVGVANTRTPARTHELFGLAWAPLRALNATGAGIIRRWWMPPILVASRMRRRTMPLLLRWPLMLNTSELAGLLGMAVDGIRLPGLTLGGSPQLPPAPDMPTDGTTIGLSDYSGMQDRPLALKLSDRLMHMHISGPTGTGKSTFVGNLALQDIAAGRCVIVVDPKNDLVDAITERFPPWRDNDLIALDASDISAPIGFNPLAGASDEIERELAVDRVLHVIREIYADFWGPRTDDVLRNALLTLVQLQAADGSPLTLCEVQTLLTNAAFRRALWASIPARLRPFWESYNHLSPTQQANVIGPVLNKLRSFTDRTALRLMLGQAHGLDLAEVMNKRQVLLVNLARGRLGGETAGLLGALFVALLQQAVLGRASLPPSARHPVMIYIDEFQEVVKHGAVAEMLDQARGFGAGLTLAHQYMHQLPKDHAHAVLGTARSQVIFQQGPEDARTLAKSMEPDLTASDLQGLDTYHVVVRPCINGRTAPPVTATTMDLPPPTRDGQALAQATRERFGMARSDVEAALQARLQLTALNYNFGRSPREVRA